MASKSRLLFLLKYLYEQTDDEHPVTGSALRAVLADAGFHAPDARTVRNDIATLIDAGYDIVAEEHPGLSTSYFFGARELEIAELRILIDAVSSSQFISESKSEELIRKLRTIGGRISDSYLQPGVFVSSRVKAKENQLLYIVQQIEEGILSRKKITFQYYNYNLNKERVLRHDGEVYTVSPYATVWNTDRYYLACYSDKHRKIVPFRIDRMGIPTVTQIPADPAPEDFDPGYYSDKVFQMYSGRDTRVTLRCDYDMIDHMIDRFGDGIRIANITETTFDTTVTVSVSVTFFAWLFQYGRSIRIISPADVRERYLCLLKAAEKSC